jgi:hypothetical protein
MAYRCIITLVCHVLPFDQLLHLFVARLLSFARAQVNNGK